MTETGVDYSDDDDYYPDNDEDGSGSGTGHDYSDNGYASGDMENQEEEQNDEEGSSEGVCLIFCFSFSRVQSKFYQIKEVKKV